MKVHEVPQELDAGHESAKKVCYAVDDQGRLVPTQSLGWAVEETVQDLAWKVIKDDLEATRLEVEAGRLSRLGYFMKWRLMDIVLLAQNMGVSSWRIKWHLRPRPFARLSDEWLQRYAECLDVPVERLKATGKLPLPAAGERR